MLSLSHTLSLTSASNGLMRRCLLELFRNKRQGKLSSKKVMEGANR